MGLVTMAGKIPQYPGRKSLEGLVGPLVAPVGRMYAGHKIQRLLGYWVLWHALGGRDGLLKVQVVSRAGEWRQRSEFLEVFGVEVQDFMPEAAARLVGGVETKGKA